MNDTIISNEVEETRGMNAEDLQTMESEINAGVGIPSDNSPSFELSNNSIISDDYFNEVCGNMEFMNFVEIVKLKKELESEKDQLISAKETVQNLLDMKSSISQFEDQIEDDDILTKIDEANTAVETGIDDMEEFISNFDNTMEKMDKLIAKADEHVHKFDGIKKTTSFLSDAMIQIIDKNISKMESSPNVTKTIKIYYKELRNIFSNRQNVDYILSKIPEKKTYIRRLKNELRKNTGDQYVKGVQKNVTVAFCSTFNVNQMTIFENYLKDLFNDDEAVFYFQYVLYLIYTAEKSNGKYGKHKWVEVLIMNILDIISDTYNLDGGKEYFDEQLLKLKDEVIKIM